MVLATGVLDSLVPIFQFNKGHASRIFDRLKEKKQMVVLKNNDLAAVLLSPEEYTRLAEADYLLPCKAVSRSDDEVCRLAVKRVREK